MARHIENMAGNAPTRKKVDAFVKRRKAKGKEHKWDRESHMWRNKAEQCLFTPRRMACA